MKSGQEERPEEMEKKPSGVHARWMMEIGIAEKARKDWKKDVKKARDIYEGKEKKSSSFNILWANTETLRPAIYNSLPRPDIRDRFERSPDKVADAASEMLENAVTYSLDAYGSDAVLRMTALDFVLAGRGVARVRYIPTIEGDSQEVVGEECRCEFVQLDDFLHGVGKTWEKVTWISFRHRMTRDELETQFGDVGAEVPLDATDLDESKNDESREIEQSFRTAEVYEIWDKDARRVIFIASSYRESPLLIVDDPLELIDFFPVPEPVFAIEKSDSLIPTTLYSLYKEQADELNVVSARINAITKSLKLRGIYDAALSEVSKLLTAGDNDMIPVESAALIADKGGLEKAIWFMPIEQIAGILAVLEGQRSAAKQVVYEITGISDIVRGASNADETATAQRIKAEFGTIRLQRMQREFQRFCRDIIRIMSEIIAENFSPETLMMISGTRFPTQSEVQAEANRMALMWQKAAASAQSQGQPPPPPPQPPDVVTIDAVIEVLHSDLQRQYRIDIETDSTIQAMEGADQAYISSMLTGIGSFVQAVGPAIQSGLIPADAAKAMLSSIIRKFKLGREVEDSITTAQNDEGGMPPEVQAAMQQVQAKQAELQQLAAELDQGKKDLAYQSKISTMENDAQKKEIEHAMEIHKIQTEQASTQTVDEVRRMLDEHMVRISQMFAPVAPQVM